MRYTDYFVTVDTHVKPVDDEQQREITQKLYAAVRKFASAPMLKALLIQDEPNKLRRAVLTNATVEMGGRYHRLHIHFNISILHDTKLRLFTTTAEGRRVGINQIVASYFTRELDIGKNTYARVTLAGSSRAKNYAIKHGASELNDFRVKIK